MLQVSTLLYIFVNGSDQKQIDKRLSEISEFKDKLNLRIMSSKLDFPYRNGLKTIPATVAAMDLARNHDFSNDDSDPAAIFLDADILDFPETNHISKMISNIHSGKIRLGTFVHVDEKQLYEKNSYYPLLQILDYALYNINSGLNILDRRYNPGQRSEVETSIDNSGAHNVYSAMLMYLTGGIKAHTNNEDTDWTKRASSALAQTHLNSFFNYSQFLNAITTQDVNSVPHDEGFYARLLETERPITDIWNNHDLIRGETSDNEPIVAFHDPEYKKFVINVYGDRSKEEEAKSLESELLSISGVPVRSLDDLLDESFPAYKEFLSDIPVERLAMDIKSLYKYLYLGIKEIDSKLYPEFKDSNKIQSAALTNHAYILMSNLCLYLEKLVEENTSLPDKDKIFFANFVQDLFLDLHRAKDKFDLQQGKRIV